MTSLLIHKYAELGRKKSQFVFNLSNGSSQLSQGLKTGFSTVFSTVLFYVFAIPLLPFLWLFFWYLTRKIKQETAFFDALIHQMESEREEVKTALGNDKTLLDLYPELTSKDYESLKRSLDVLLQKEELLAVLFDPSTRQEDEPRLIKGLLRASETCYYRFKAANSVFSELIGLYDVNAPQGDYFDTATEQELWENRNKAYNYLV
jgi:hypothetical protein